MRLVHILLLFFFYCSIAKDVLRVDSGLLKRLLFKCYKVYGSVPNGLSYLWLVSPIEFSSTFDIFFARNKKKIIYRLEFCKK